MNHSKYVSWHRNLQKYIEKNPSPTGFEPMPKVKRPLSYSLGNGYFLFQILSQSCLTISFQIKELDCVEERYIQIISACIIIINMKQTAEIEPTSLVWMPSSYSKCLFVIFKFLFNLPKLKPNLYSSVQTDPNGHCWLRQVWKLFVL